MRKTKKIIATVFLFLFIAVLLLTTGLKTPLCKYFFSFYFSSKLDCDINIGQCSFFFTRGIKAQKISIKNNKGFIGSIENADIKFNVVKNLREGNEFDFFLGKVIFSYPDSDIVKWVVKLFAVDSEYLFKFDEITGFAYVESKEMILKDVEAIGEDVSVFVDGTTKEKQLINYTIKLKISDKITAGIPDTLRAIFFRKDEKYSIVQLYLSGSLNKPAINFSTPLFKLKIN
jgi:hypothetical protein